MPSTHGRVLLCVPQSSSLETRNWQLETDVGSPLWKGGGGNAAGGLSLSYDALGRLVTDGEALTCTYDALGNRLQTVGCCSITPEIWIPNHADPLKRPLMMYDAEGDEVYYYYIWGGNRLLGVIENGEFWNEDDALFVAHSDEIGSVIAFTDLCGNLLYSANYGPHGEDWGSTGYNPTPFAWLGGYGVQVLETDTPLKLYLTRHRVYSATLNRFLSSDPIGLAGGSNLYMYGEGNPMAYIDPLGLCASDGGFWSDVGDYLRESGTFLLGELSAVGLTAWGIVESVASNPYQNPTIQNIKGEWERMVGLYDAATHPLDTLNGFIGNISDTWNSGTFGQGQIFGYVLVTAGMLAAPYASRASAAAAGNNTGLMGSKGFELKNPKGVTYNTPGSVAGREYTGHAFDQMQNRGIMPSVVENTVKVGTPTLGKVSGTTAFYDPVNNVSVIIDTQSGRVVTAGFGVLKQ